MGLAAALALAAAGCGGDEGNPVEVRLQEKTAEQTVLGFPALATKNTTRVGGKDPVEDAAGVATAVYPGRAGAQRPELVALVDRADWRGGIAAAALMAAPLRAPILLTDGGDVPGATEHALSSLEPTGAREAGGAQAIRVGDAGVPEDLRATQITGGDPYALAAAIDAFVSDAAGRPSRNVVVVSAQDPRFAMPAAGWAAKSGDPVLFVQRDEAPAVTRRAIRRHERPGIYVLGPRAAVSNGVLRELGKLGRVKRVSGPTPVENAIAFARYADGEFGWGVRDPGHGLVIANSSRTLDAAAGAPLSASGNHGPLLLIDSQRTLPPALESYLLDIQPGYRFDPVRGVYNHAWLMGDESAISTAAQARIDALTEIVRVRQGEGA
jgi:hypothetical protein